MNISLLLVIAMAAFVLGDYSGGWDPRYCCYPVPEECCPTKVCPECLDVAVVLDISGSIGQVNYDTLYVPFLVDFLNSNSWTIGPNDDDYRVSLTTFSSCVESFVPIVFDCDVLVNWGDPASFDTALYADVLDNITVSGITNTGQGLKDTRETVLMGAGNRDTCPDACIVVTDGAENVNATFFEEELAKFHMNCDFVIAIGVSTSVPPEQLERIAGSADAAFQVEDFESLESLLPTLEDALCNGSGSSSGDSSSTGCCPYEYPTYFHLMGY